MDEKLRHLIKDYMVFEEKTKEFYDGKLPKNEYKGISGGFGSYAERGGRSGMLRIRIPGGRLTKERLHFLLEMAEVYHIKKMKLTTCETIQLHYLQPWEICAIAAEALENGIICRGGGGDFPRNVMVSPLTGVGREEYFDVMPYAEEMSDYLLSLIGKVTLPRKLKVCFSSSPENVVHATYRDLGFAANADGTFDVYAAGGLGLKPKLGLKVAEHILPEDVLYFAKAMIDVFTEHGNYQVRSQARTRFMQDTLGKEGFVKEFERKLAEAKGGESLKIHPAARHTEKTGEGSICHKRIIPQKQKGLYAVLWHPLGGETEPEAMKRIYETIKDMEDVEVRLSPDESAYIINLTAAEAQKVLDATAGGAETLFEYSVACIGADICQQGLRDSQGFLRKCVQAVRQAGIRDGALPKIHISGCPSSCGTHQTAPIGFQGGVKKAEGEMKEAFTVFFHGASRQGEEKISVASGMMLADEIPDFLIELGRTVENAGCNYEIWADAHPDELERIAEKYMK